MDTSMKLDILSVENVLYSGDAHFVVVPGESGELGIYPRHAPLLTRIRPGVVTLVDARAASGAAFWWPAACSK